MIYFKTDLDETELEGIVENRYRDPGHCLEPPRVNGIKIENGGGEAAGAEDAGVVRSLASALLQVAQAIHHKYLKRPLGTLLVSRWLIIIYMLSRYMYKEFTPINTLTRLTPNISGDDIVGMFYITTFRPRREGAQGSRSQEQISGAGSAAAVGGVADGVPQLRQRGAASADAGQQRVLVGQRAARQLPPVPPPHRPRQHAALRQLQQRTPSLLPQAKAHGWFTDHSSLYRILTQTDTQ